MENTSSGELRKNTQTRNLRGSSVDESTSIETEVLMNSSEVSKIRERVDRLQRGILPMLNAQPPTI